MTASVDWRGVAIVPGAVVVYPVAASTSVRMVEAVVLEVPEEGALVVEVIRENYFGRMSTERAGRRTALPVARHVTVLHDRAPLPTGESTTTTDPEEPDDV